MKPKNLLSLSLAFAALLLAPAVQAQVFVTTTVDEADGDCSDGDCSLRDAVAVAPSSGFVAVPPGTYVLTLGPITTDKILTISGDAFPTPIIDGNNASRIFETAPGSEVALQALTLTRGNADGNGGAVLSQGRLALVACTVKDNTASGDGGGVAAAGELFVYLSTFSGNRASSGGAIARNAPSNHTISNSTFSSNGATNFGGAWSCGSSAFAGTLDVLNSTFTGNEGFPDALDHYCTGAVLTLANTIFAGNGSDGVPDCDFSESTATSSHVLAGDGSCTLGGPGDLPNTDPLLGPLANNGGPTDTHLPGAGSPALDAADSAVCAAFPVSGLDQRLVSRPQGTGCDIGSVEVVVNAPPDCSGATSSVASIWPPNHKMAKVSIQGVTDPDGDPVSIQIDQVRQDELTNDAGDGNTCPDAQGLGTATASVRAERNGQGNGRVYTLSFTATDEQGATCQGSVQVCVPHSSKGSCVNGGPLFDSTVCSGGM